MPNETSFKPGSPASSSESGLPTSVNRRRREKDNRKVWIGRYIFVAFLCLAAVCMGLVTFRLLDDAAVTLAETKFDSIADRALDTAKQTTFQKHMGAVTASKLVANANPNASQWPQVAILGFESIIGGLIEASSGRNMALCPFVSPEQLNDFETFVYNFYFHERDPPFPEGTATSSFGFGVWGKDPSLNTTDQRYHVSDGSTSYGSPNKIFAPVIQHDSGEHVTLMLDVHYQETRGKIIDQMISCSQERAQKEEADMDCGAITDFLILEGVLASQSTRPGALLMQPIYPAYSPLQITGLIASSLVWDEVIANAFTSSDRGIDCVLSSSGGGQYTYSVVDGNVDLRGEGYLHSESSYDKYCVVIDLATTEEFGETATAYTLEICPTTEFFDTYRTKSPVFATIGAVCVIVASTILFLGYDSCVRGTLEERKSLLEAKRNFVRFVSHEVRTPLSSVCMGLSLIKADMEKSTPSLRDRCDRESPSSVEHGGKVEEWYGQMQEVLDNAKSSVDVLNDMLAYDKIEVGAFKLELDVVPTWSLVEKTVKEFQLAANAKHLMLSLNFCSALATNGSISDEEEAPVLTAENLDADALSAIGIADSFRVSQVLRNLLSNALKFTDSGGSVKVRAAYLPNSDIGRQKVKEDALTLNDGRKIVVHRAGTMNVTVTDTGAGMTPEQVSQLFRQNVQFNANKLQNGQGSGLGLYIAKGIAEQHGGSLSATSPGLGKGSTFIFSLPLFRSSDTMEGILDYHASVTELVQEDCTSQLDDVVDRPAQELRVLVIDDARTNRRLLARWLKNQGHYCDEAADGVEGVDMVRKSAEGYDVLLVDYEMPRMNGPDAIKKIRSLGYGSFVVGISGNVLPEDVELFMISGADAVLPKPLQFSDLDSLLSKYTFPPR